MDHGEDSTMSFLGHRLIEPAAALLDHLLAAPHPGTTEVQTGARENGCAASVCLLLIVMLESFIARAQIMTRSNDPRARRRAPADFFRRTYPGSPLAEHVEEVFVLRDAIAHNHIWHVAFETPRGRWMKLLRRNVNAWSGDGKFKSNVDGANAMTRRLKLKVQPTMIDRYDVREVLRTVLAALRAMDQKENGRLGLDRLRADFDGEEDLDLPEILNRVDSRLTIALQARSAGRPGARRRRE